MTRYQRKYFRSFTLSAVTLLSLAVVSFAQAPPPDLDAYTARVLKEFEVPGVAIAIVKDGKVALTLPREKYAGRYQLSRSAFCSRAWQMM